VKRRGKIRARIVEGHASGRVGAIKGHGGGHVSFVTERPARGFLRIPNPEPTFTTPDGRNFRISRRALSAALRPHAHELAAFLLLAASNPKRKPGEPVSIPFDVANFVACLLRGLPSTRRGRPRKVSTNQALELVLHHSVREAARLIAKSTGENPENIRASVYGAKRRARKGGNKFK
jgi:hypothetical protein